MNVTHARTVAEAPSGILTAHVEPGHPWDALRALREGMEEVRQSGGDPRLAFLYGISEEGRFTSLGAASLIVLGYEAA